MLIGWGSEGQITEYLPDGKLVFHAFLDGGFLQDKVQNYRTFRCNWTGFSPETIAVFAEAIDFPPATDVYVSWNGDTETVIWRFVWSEQTIAGLTTKMEDVTRTGFETTLRLSEPPAAIGAIHVEAINSDGRVLMVSQDVRAVPAYWRSTASNKVMQANESGKAAMSVNEL